MDDQGTDKTSDIDSPTGCSAHSYRSKEENNNDPNNNMDSIEMNGAQNGAEFFSGAASSRPREASPPSAVDRTNSPQPGCSKESPNLEKILEKTDQIMNLVKKIRLPSILNAIYKNHGVPINEIKLWDLIPNDQRHRYLEITFSDDEESSEPSDVEHERPKNLPKDVASQKSRTTTSNGSKRAPDVDICTVESKKSFTNADLMNLRPGTVSTASENFGSTTDRSINRGAISKVRGQTSTPQKSSVKNIFRKCRQPMEDLEKLADLSFVNDYKEYGNYRRIQNNEQIRQNIEQPRRNNEQPRQNNAQTQPQARADVPVRQPPVKRKVCMEMYYKLRNIFPNIDRKYIEQLCPPEWGPGDHDAQLAPLVDHLLTHADTIRPELPVVEDDRPDNDIMYVNDVDGIYENLLGIFPDADPHYLRHSAEKNLGRADDLKKFVEFNLVKRDYPTRDEYMARLEITEQQRQYTTGFNVQNFLSIIPDPSKHFMNPQRKCAYDTVAFEFLKSFYNKNRVVTISRTYASLNYNLTLTADSLRSVGPELKRTRNVCDMPTEDIKLLQEIAFIRNRTDIENHLQHVKEEESREFDALKKSNQLLQCQCCYDSECIPRKCSTCNNGHVFCNNCVLTGTNAQMSGGETRIHCFAGCESEFSPSVLQEVLGPTVFSKLLKERQAAEVLAAGIEGLVSCPFCHFASIPPEGDNIFKCLNPECTKESCRLCQKLSHVPFKCDDRPDVAAARHFVEEKMTDALARKCYKCPRRYIKEDGCNKISCLCGAIMCYLCDAPVKDYTHFAGQGSDAVGLCPLWSDSARLDAMAVRAVGERAQLHLEKRDPNVKIDTTALLPTIPEARNGPHDMIQNADQLPQHAQRVLDLPPQ